MGELYKTQHTIDEMLDRMGVKIVLDSEHLSEEDKFEAEKNGASVVLKKVSDKEDKKTERRVSNKAAGKPAAFLCFLSGGLPLCVW